jgi:hypothetical protein
MIKGRNFFTGLVFAGVMVILGLSLISCEDVTGFFSHSWGESLRRDPKKLVGDVTSSNVKDMVKTFAGDPEASKALLDEIVKAAANAKTPQEKGALRSAGLTAAANASGLGTTILSSAGAFLNSDNDEDEFDKLTDVLNGLSDIQDIAEDIVELFDGGVSDGIYPNIDENAGNDLIMAAVICLLGDYQDKDSDDLEEYMESFAEYVDPDRVSDSFNPRQKTAYYLLKTAKKNGAEGVLGDLLKEFNF